MELQASLETFLLAPEYAEIPPVYKRLMKDALAHYTQTVVEQIRDKTLEEVERQRATKEEQAQIVKVLATKSLHSEQSKRIIKVYAAEALDKKLRDNPSTISESYRSVIRKIVLEELSAESKDTIAPPPPAPNFHSSQEIRTIIIENMESIQEYFGAREVALSAVADHLQRYTEIREGDLIRGKCGSRRWNTQVSNAINTDYWKNCPIVSTGIRGQYRIEMWK